MVTVANVFRVGRLTTLLFNIGSPDDVNIAAPQMKR